MCKVPIKLFTNSFFVIEYNCKWHKVVESGDNMLIGEYHHNIDEKGRLIIPAKYREEIGSSFVVTKGLDGCLYVYSLLEWERITSKLKTLPFTKKSARTFTRFYYRVLQFANLINKVE